METDLSCRWRRVRVGDGHLVENDTLSWRCRLMFKGCIDVDYLMRRLVGDFSY